MRIGAVLVLIAAAIPAFQGGELTGPQLIANGRLEEALTFYRTAAGASPTSVAANNGMGVVLDLLARYPEAQTWFTRSINAARTPLERALAQRAMAISHGFAGDCRGAEKYETSAYDFYLRTADFYNAGEVADELGRLCLDNGDLNRAAEWYQKGNAAGLNQPDIPVDRKDLWNVRLAHAKARIAARRGKIAEARKYVSQTRAILDKGTNPAQEEYFPYLTGYVAFYAGDYPAALAALQLANLQDPFIQCLIARTYEALGNREKSLEYYRMAASSPAHSVPAAYARPFAARKLH
ncbi:MAG: hypothetical protein ABJC09_11875 [Terriglobia bacterium]